MKILEIKTTYGGTFIYKQGILEDGTLTGKIRYTGQEKHELNLELLDSIDTGRDDVKSFVSMITGR